MSTGMIDDSGDWKVPEQKSEADRTHAARVKFVQHALASRILAIPADCSKQGRAVRVGQIRNKVADYTNWLCKTHIWGGSKNVSITDTKQRDLWISAFCAGWKTVKAALDAGEDLTAFLFGGEATDYAG